MKHNEFFPSKYNNFYNQRLPFTDINIIYLLEKIHNRMSFLLGASQIPVKNVSLMEKEWLMIQ